MQHTNQADPGPFIDTAALAMRHHTSPGNLANLRLRREGVPYVKIGSRVLYALAAVEQYEAARLVETSAA